MILVVDDYPDACRTLARLLKLQSLEAQTAFSGADALSWMESAKPSLVILDVMMPGMSGIEVLEKMKSDERLSAVPVIMFSASMEPEHRTKAMALGAVDCVVKSAVDYRTFLSNVAAYANKDA